MDEVSREIREANKADDLRRKEKWRREHPKLVAFKKGWGTALAKEGRSLGKDLSREIKKTFGLW